MGAHSSTCATDESGDGTATQVVLSVARDLSDAPTPAPVPPMRAETVLERRRKRYSISSGWPWSTFCLPWPWRRSSGGAEKTEDSVGYTAEATIFGNWIMGDQMDILPHYDFKVSEDQYTGIRHRSNG